MTANKRPGEKIAVLGDDEESFVLGERPDRLVVVTGPDREGEIGILAADCVYLSRFEAEDLANEILRRLAPRGK